MISSGLSFSQLLRDSLIITHSRFVTSASAVNASCLPLPLCLYLYFCSLFHTYTNISCIHTQAHLLLLLTLAPVFSFLALGLCSALLCFALVLFFLLPGGGLCIYNYGSACLPACLFASGSLKLQDRVKRH